jgi:hypothetical protein
VEGEEGREGNARQVVQLPSRAHATDATHSLTRLLLLACLLVFYGARPRAVQKYNYSEEDVIPVSLRLTNPC